MGLQDIFAKVSRRILGYPTGGYVYQPPKAALSYEQAIEVLKGRGLDVRRGQPPYLDEAGVVRLADAIRAEGIPVEDMRVDSAAYTRYVEAAGYAGQHSNYYAYNRTEKSFEHFVSLEQLHLGPGDRMIDLASEESPVPEIYARLAGAESYAQDIMYPPGIQGRRIGGDACAMPVPDAFAAGATLTCSLEHFEGDGDARLIGEVARVLKPGGRLVVAPLYLAEYECTQTDPLYSAATDVPFDAGTAVHCAEGWGNRHGRFYSPGSLRRRLVEPHRHLFDFRVYRFANPAELPPGIYLRWVLVCTRL